MYRQSLGVWSGFPHRVHAYAPWGGGVCTGFRYCFCSVEAFSPWLTLNTGVAAVVLAPCPISLATFAASSVSTPSLYCLLEGQFIVTDFEQGLQHCFIAD